MQLTPQHYVPVLRWKRGEWVALRHLDPLLKKCIAPIVEITPNALLPKPTRRSSRAPILVEIADEFLKSWGVTPFFLDVGMHLDSDRASEALHSLGDHANKRNLKLIPVTGINRTPRYQETTKAIAKIFGTGIGLRVIAKELNRQLTLKVSEILSQLHTVPQDVHLFVDMQLVNEEPMSYVEICNALPHFNQWRNVAIIAGAFPKDLSGFSVGIHEFPRREWLRWKDQILLNAAISRKPSFGDYSTQHSIFTEPPERANFSASIRYTSDDKWVIMRGEGVFSDGSPGFSQWPANAILLCDRDEFCGPDFSAGDNYIHTMSQQTEKNGSAETWLRAGINHHLTFVARQLIAMNGLKDIV